jgi:RNA-binding protein 5/10
LNSQKEAMREGFKKSFHPLQQNEQKKEAAAADAGFAILEKSKTERVFESNLMPPPPADSFQPKPAAAAAVPGLVAEYGEDSEEEPEADPESDADPEKQFSDWSKMACLLCKRQFPNKEGLQRHNQLSDLHKSNLEDYLKTKAPSMNSQGTLTAAGQLQYRDRAKERRQKYGAPAPPEPKRSKAKAPVVYEQPTQQGIGSDNIGNKLMQKMGWNAGEGLGRGKHGIRDPVQASRRTMGAGLGASGSTVQLDPNDTYKDAVKKTMFARFHEMD